MKAAIVTIVIGVIMMVMVLVLWEPSSFGQPRPKMAEVVEPNACVNTDSWIMPEPNESDIENIRLLGNNLINIADHAQGIIDVNEYVRRGNSELGRWEWIEPNNSVGCDRPVLRVAKEGDIFCISCGHIYRQGMLVDPNEVKE